MIGRIIRMFPQISFNENYDLDAHLGAHYLKHMAYLSSLMANQ